MNIRDIAEYTLEKLTKAGVDAAQVGVSHGSEDELNVDNAAFSLMRTLFDTDIAIKVICDGRKGISSINQTDKEAIDAAIAECIASARSGVRDDAERIAPFEGKEKFSEGVFTPDIDALYERMSEILRDMKSEFPKVVMGQFIAKYVKSDTIYLNTNGTEFEYAAGKYNTSLEFSASEGDMSSSMNYYGHVFTNLDRPFLDHDLTRQLLRENEMSLYTTPVPGKFVGDVIITPACLDMLLYYASANFAGDSAVIDGTGLWRDKLGEQVASKSLNIDYAPLDPRIVCGERFAGGFKSANMPFIKNGVLQNLRLSDYAARKTGKKRASTQAGNAIIQPGDTPLDEMIKSIERGLIVARFSGGAPATNGDISGVAKNSFLVENGKISGAVSETMITGNLAAMLNSVSAISKEIVCDGTGVLPWIQFGGVTISGK